MLPGLRFLFAASMLAASLLVFGMGAIALLRASHQQVSNLTAQPAPEPVFAQAPQTVPSLSMLRTDATVAETAPIAADAGRLAALTSALREPDPLPAPVPTPEPPPMIAEPQPAVPAPPVDARSETAPEPEILQKSAPAEATVIATAPAVAPPPPPSPPEITGSTPTPAVNGTAKPLIANPKIANPPLPHARPQAANQIAALTPAASDPPNVVAAKKARSLKRRYAKRPRERLAPATSSNPLSALFGGGSN